MTARALFLVPVIAAGLAGCFPTGEFHCITDLDCVTADGTSGSCEPNQFCSFPDGTCPSGSRFGAGAGDVSGECTTGVPPDGPETPDAAADAAFPGDACLPGEDPELCNGLDDNCNMSTDEGFVLGDPCDGGDSDLCNEGVTVCDGTGTGTTCDDATGDTVELCNGADDDCDTNIDDGYDLGTACDGPDTDFCTEGVTVCNPAMTGTVCDDATGNNVELCNGADDDCDMTIDDGFVLGMACDGTDGDLCAEGVTVCNPAMTGTVCNDTTGTNVELCNGSDDNCNLITDEGFDVGATCDGNDTDACMEGMKVCNPSGSGTVCTDMTSSTTETCNGVDDDCQNGIDDPWPLLGTPCTVGVGACARTGTWICNGPSAIQCSVSPGAPAPEFCGDAIDSDCSGGTDPVCPTNDLRSGATVLTGTGTSMADLTFAHDNTVGSCGAAGGRDVFYQFTLAAAEVVYVDTFGSNFDTIIKIENGTCAAAGAQNACVNNSCAVSQTQYAAQLAAGTYCLVIDQASSAVTTGTLTMSFVRGGRTGTAVALGASTQTGTTVGAPNLSGGTCNATMTGEVAYWFTVCPETRMSSANTCTTTPVWDSMLYFRRGSGIGTGPDVVCDDDACGASLLSRITNASLVGPHLFWIIVDGYDTSSGAYTLQLTL